MRYWTEPHYRYELGIGERCNMRCPFCMEKGGGYKANSVTLDQLDWFADYMQYHHKKMRYDVSASVYGGESLLYLDKIMHFAERISPFAEHMVVVSNGLHVQRYGAELQELRKLFNGNFQVNVSYNFSMQDDTRQAGTYEIVRDSIRYLCNELGWHLQSTMVFTPATLHRMYEVFMDWRELYEECGGRNRARFNYTRADIPWETVDVEHVREELEKFRQARAEKPEYKDGFGFNWVGPYRGERRRDCLFSRVPAALCADGGVYPGYEVIYSNQFVKDLLRLGTAGDDFAAVDARRFHLLRTLPVKIPAPCKDCPSQCRVLPWRTVVDSAEQYEGMPHPERCTAMRLIGEYL